MQEAVTLAPAINVKSRKIAQAREENSMERLTAPKRTFAHPVVKKPPKVSQADFNKRQRERYVHALPHKKRKEALSFADYPRFERSVLSIANRTKRWA
jgi:hypothetical protein|eukprot:COSAG06_NODE_390_length_16395_cov_6.904332_7_plen_98_part_00